MTTRLPIKFDRTTQSLFRGNTSQATITTTIPHPLQDKHVKPLSAVCRSQSEHVKMKSVDVANETFFDIFEFPFLFEIIKVE